MASMRISGKVGKASVVKVMMLTGVVGVTVMMGVVGGMSQKWGLWVEGAVLCVGR